MNQPHPDDPQAHELEAPENEPSVRDFHAYVNEQQRTLLKLLGYLEKENPAGQGKALPPRAFVESLLEGSPGNGSPDPRGRVVGVVVDGRNNVGLAVTSGAPLQDANHRAYVENSDWLSLPSGADGGGGASGSGGLPYGTTVINLFGTPSQRAALFTQLEAKVPQVTKANGAVLVSYTAGHLTQQVVEALSAQCTKPNRTSSMVFATNRRSAFLGIKDALALEKLGARWKTADLDKQSGASAAHLESLRRVSEEKRGASVLRRSRNRINAQRVPSLPGALQQRQAPTWQGNRKNANAPYE